MQVLGFSTDDITSIDRILASILHLGNIDFETDKDHVGSTITKPEEAREVARLLGMEEEQVVKILTSRVLASQKEVIHASLSPVKAKWSRDALAKVCCCNSVCIIIIAERISARRVHRCLISARLIS